MLNRARVSDQITRELQAKIADGTLERGAKLPTERALAATYNVSSPTIREAMRVLSSMGLVEVRRGSGAYVAISSRSILDQSLSMLVEWDKVGVADLIGLLQVLNLYVADVALERAESLEIERVVAAAEATARFETVDEALASFDNFLATFVACAHQPLLDALCGFLTRVLVQLELDYHPDRSTTYWQNWATDSSALRLAVAMALRDRDRDLLIERVGIFHQSIRERLMNLPGIRDARVIS